jgi:ABC-type phosphate/phosphonate transport system substrate-binding protein
MRVGRLILALGMVLLTIALAVWLGRLPSSAPALSLGNADGGSSTPLRLALMPEGDVFLQRRRYQALADHLAEQLHRPVNLVTEHTFDSLLEDFAAGEVDGAFLESYLAAVTMDRWNARPVASVRRLDRRTNCQGAIVVHVESEFRAVGHLAGRTVAMVRATSAAALFPLYELSRHEGLAQDPPRIIWTDTDEAALLAVIEGRAHACAARLARVDQFEAARDDASFRRLAVSDHLPGAALVLQAAVADRWEQPILAILLAMGGHPPGRDVLSTFGAAEFVAADLRAYDPVLEMVAHLQPSPHLLGLTASSTVDPDPPIRER